MSHALCSALLTTFDDDLFPTMERIIKDLGGDSEGTLVHVRPTNSTNSLGEPTNSVAVLIHHLCGVLLSWGAGGLGGEQVDRQRDSEFSFEGAVEPELTRLRKLVHQLPMWTEQAVQRGAVATPHGTGFPYEQARKRGILNIEWVLLHIFHDLAQHVGHMELTRDVLLAD